jgi:signal transduction histidine kinase
MDALDGALILVVEDDEEMSRFICRSFAARYRVAAAFDGEEGRHVRLAERLADLAALAVDNARLHDAARRAVAARDEIVGIVAHDLRSPLNVIVMATSLLRQVEEPDRRDHRQLDLIERGAARMNRFIEDMLDVVRVESGRLSVCRDSTAAQAAMAGALDEVRAAATKASLELRVEVSGELPDVLADRDRLLQVFDNLLTNAIEFTPAGGQVTVRAMRQDGHVVFSVADTGNGIRAEDLPHVFDRFWQSRRADRRGVGLGLPIVKGIVEAHGGRVWVESEVGVGTTFSFTLEAVPTT